MAFLKALVATLSVAAAARSVGMSRQSAYRLRARLGPEFGRVWDDGLKIGLTMRRAGNAAASAPRQGDAWRAQGDARRAQGDGFAAQIYGFRPQGDT